MNLSSEQLNIIHHEAGHGLVNAVPGSGKTTTMVARICHLASSGVDPKKVMVLMFNKTARDDFQNKLLKSLKDSHTPFEKDRIAEIRTLSSLAYKAISLLQSSEALPEYELAFENQRIQNHLAREALKACDMHSSQANIDYVKDIVSWVKSRVETPINYIGLTEGVEIDLFHAYEKLRHHKKIRFCEDWPYDTIVAIRENEALLDDVLNSRYKYIIVDEFQDISPVQYALINIYVKSNTELMVVGDVNQSIYAWRGADPGIMLKDLPEKYQPQMYSLSNTFRFGQKLSEAANNLIRHNTSRFDFDCVSRLEIDTQIDILPVCDYRPAELVNQIAQGEYRQIAILGREKWSWMQTEWDFLKHEIPYQVYTNDAQCVLDSPAIKSILGYLMLADGAENLYQLDVNHRKDIISCMLSIPSLFLDLRYKKQLIDRLSEHPDSYQIFPDIKRQIKEELKVEDKVLAGQCKAVDDREDIWDVCLGLSREKSNAYRSLKLILKSHELNFYGFIKRSCLRASDAEYRIKLIDSLLDLADHVKDSAKTIGQFLDYINGLHDAYRSRLKDDRQNAVTITTMHRSKGLEWDHVILPDLFNHTMPVKDEQDQLLDEEGDRRLLYVAMTRAKQSLKMIGGEDANDHAALFDEVLPAAYNGHTSKFIFETMRKECATTIKNKKEFNSEKEITN